MEIFSNNIVTLIGIGTIANSTNPATGCNIISLKAVFNYIKAKIDDNQLQVDWSTANESNNAFFEIQLSKDGKEFKTIGTIKSKGDTEIGHNYSFTESVNNIYFISIIALLGVSLFSLKNRKYNVLYLMIISSLICWNLGCNAKKDIVKINSENLSVRVVQVDKQGLKSFSKSTILKTD